jgi:uncharacterized membrane protein HdeD (DUF308 family)
MSEHLGSYSAAGMMLGRSARLARNWWTLVLRGMLAILFGVVALVWPGAAIGSLVLVFGVYMLVDGVFTLIGAFGAASHHGRWFGLILEGVIDLLVGAIALTMPLATVLAVVWLAAAWAVVSGAALLWAGVGLHRKHGRWLIVLAAIVSIAWGALLFLAPVAGAVVLAWWLGVYALLFGVVMIAAGLHLRRMHTA